MKQRIISVFIALLAMTGMARAQNNYGIILGGVVVTSDNYFNLTAILTSQGVLSSGEVSFDPTSATLYCQNITLNNSSGVAFSVSNTPFKRLKIKLIGENQMVGQYGFVLNANTKVIIDGPGKLYMGGSYRGLYLNEYSKLVVRDVEHLQILSTYAKSESVLAVFNSKVTFYSNISGFLTSFLTQGVRFEDSRVYFNETSGCFFTTATGRESDQARLLPHPTVIDYNSDGAIDDTDIDLWHYKKLGLVNLPNVAGVNADLNQDGNTDAADLVMFYNYKTGTRKQGWRLMTSLMDVNTHDAVSPNTEQSIIYSGSNTKKTWALVDFYEFELMVDDQDASHFSCSSWNSDVAEVSLVPVTIYGNLTTIGFQVNVKKTGHTTIVCNYDDGNGNTARMEVPLSCFKSTDVLASGDRIYAVQVDDDGVLSNIALNTNMNVPVRTTMLLSIDKQLQGGYSLDDRNARIASTVWTVSGNDDVTLEKTSNGYVKVKVNSAGAFTVTCTDCNNNSRSATFKARDVYFYSDKEVCKNINYRSWLSTPEAKTSSTMGKAQNVDIRKMVTYNGDVWTIINHYYKRSGSTPIGNASKRMVVPVYAQVYRNKEVFYESEDTYLEDIALYGNHLVVVGGKYDPSLEYGDSGNGSEDNNTSGIVVDEAYSYRISAFYAHLDISTQEVSENLNPFSNDRQSFLKFVTYNENTGDVSMLGYVARRRKEWGLTKYHYGYPHDWAYMRWNSNVTVLKEAQKRKDNDNYSYSPTALTVASNTVVALINKSEYHAVSSSSNSAFFMYSKPERLLFYNFQDNEDGGSTVVDETASNFVSITSASSSSPLYLIRHKDGEVYKYSNDFKSYELCTNTPDFYYIDQMKVVKNGVQPEEFFWFGKKERGGGKMFFSVFGSQLSIFDMFSGFDIMMY